MLVKRVVDGEVVTRRFDRGLVASVLFGECVEVRVLDANLSLNLTVLIDDCNLRFAFVEIDSEVVHGVASGVSA